MLKKLYQLLNEGTEKQKRLDEIKRSYEKDLNYMQIQ